MRIPIADDHAIVRQGWKEILEHEMARGNEAGSSERALLQTR